MYDDDYIYYKREGDFIFILPEKIREASLIIFPFYIFLILFRAPKDLKNDDYTPERGKKRRKKCIKRIIIFLAKSRSLVQTSPPPPLKYTHTNQSI